jgi:tripartite-type tricarboxylate transporter receptor subunit TctC
MFDLIGRPFVERMKPPLGTMVVENIAGAGASLGAAAVARAQPDGYTLLMSGTGTHVNDTLIRKRPAYDPDRDLTPVVCLAVGYPVLVVHPSVPAQTLEEFMTYARARRGSLSFGHNGVGSTHHLAGELFKLLI